MQYKSSDYSYVIKYNQEKHYFIVTCCEFGIIQMSKSAEKAYFDVDREVCFKINLRTRHNVELPIPITEQFKDILVNYNDCYQKLNQIEKIARSK